MSMMSWFAQVQLHEQAAKDDTVCHPATIIEVGYGPGTEPDKKRARMAAQHRRR